MIPRPCGLTLATKEIAVEPLALFRSDKQPPARGTGKCFSVYAFVHDDASRKPASPPRRRCFNGLPDDLGRGILGRLERAVEDVLADVLGIAPEFFESLDFNASHTEPSGRIRSARAYSSTHVVLAMFPNGSRPEPRRTLPAEPSFN